MTYFELIPFAGVKYHFGIPWFKYCARYLGSKCIIYSYYQIYMREILIKAEMTVGLHESNFIQGNWDIVL